MGIELQLYRARIGRHAFRASHRTRVQLNDASSDVALCGTLFLVLITTGLLCGLMVHEVATSPFVEGFCGAFSGHAQCGSVLPPVAKTPPTMIANHHDLTRLVSRCGDVETNPGPSLFSEEQLDVIRLTIRESIREEMEAMRTEIRSLTRKFDRIDDELKTIRARVGNQEKDLHDIETSHDMLVSRFDQMEKRAEDQERRDRRDNVVIFGLPEPDNERSENGEAAFIEAVNSVLTNKLSTADVVRAHRIGKKTTEKPRPLIGRLLRTSDKVAILEKRPEFRKRGLGVGNDLTHLQRQQLQSARDDGMIGYFKGGTLYTKPRPQLPESARPNTRSYSRQQHSETNDCR